MTRYSGLGNRGQQFVAALFLAAGVSGLPGTAAQAQKAPAKSAKAAPQSAWVKLCETAKLKKAKKGGKTATTNKKICLTHHERLDGTTGRVIISAAIRNVEGRKKPNLMVMVPLGMALPPGIKAAVYNKEQWARAQKKQRVADKELKPIALKYSLCHPAGCTAEIVAPDNLIKSMKTGGGLMVLALNAAGQPVAFAVPLTGFAAAHAGAPVDNKAYTMARAKLMQQIQQRMRQRIAERQAGGKVPEPKKQ